VPTIDFTRRTEKEELGTTKSRLELDSSVLFD